VKVIWNIHLCISIDLPLELKSINIIFITSIKKELTVKNNSGLQVTTFKMDDFLNEWIQIF
jgi:hypothetical protein